MKVIGIAGWSGAGKTTLIAKVIPVLMARGLCVSTIKHAHHNFDIDKPGKDSYVHREAGATEVLVVSGRRWALMHELRGGDAADAPDLSDLLTRLSPVDLVIVEGFKRGGLAKIEVHRADNAKPFLHPTDPHITALASDAPPLFPSVPHIALNDIAGVADHMLISALPLEVAILRLRAA